jgi:HK97 family phage major capsid protein
MDTPNLESAFEKQLEVLGDNLESTISEWRSSEESKRDELQQQIKSLEGAIEEVKSNIAEERRGHLPGVEVATSEQKTDSFSMARACRALARKDFRDAPYEKEVFAEMKEKAMSTGVDPSGGYIVPEEAITQVIEKLKANVVAYDLGARDLAASSTPLTIPKLTTSATGYWVSENSTITASDLGFEQINMTPKTVAGRVILSNLLLETSTPTADSIIEEDLASQLGLALDLGVLNGSSGGGAGEPVGIMQTAGVSTVVSTVPDADTPPTPQIMMEFLSDLDAANALRGRLGWAIHPTMLSQIRQMTVDGNGESVPLTAVNTADGFATTLFGYQFRTSTQMTAPTTGTGSWTRSVCFGNWDDVLIARWGGLRLLASDTSDDAFSKDQTHIRATMRCDVALRHPESFSYCVDS